MKSKFPLNKLVNIFSRSSRRVTTSISGNYVNYRWFISNGHYFFHFSLNKARSFLRNSQRSSEKRRKWVIWCIKRVNDCTMFQPAFSLNLDTLWCATCDHRQNILFINSSNMFIRRDPRSKMCKRFNSDPVRSRFVSSLLSVKKEMMMYTRADYTTKERSRYHDEVKFDLIFTGHSFRWYIALTSSRRSVLCEANMSQLSS